MPERDAGVTTTNPDSGEAPTLIASLPLPIHPGTVLAGKFEVDRVLGEGGMGVVVAARHLHLQREVAIKFLLPEVAREPETVERFFREAQAASRVRSEHVVRVLDVGRLDRGVPFMVMEMLEGRDLAAVLRDDGPLPVRDAVDWVLQAMEALAEAHAAGIVHRDLKPSNVFLTRRADGTPFVKVLDFGLCKDVSSDAKGRALTRSSTGAMGSPLYMAPEQVRSAKEATFASDVWSIGVMLHELVTNDVPFDGETVGAILGAILTDPPRPLRAANPRLPARLEAAVLRCLVKDPAGRHRDLAALARALAPLASRAGRVSVERIAGTLAAATGGEAVRRSTAPRRVVLLGLGIFAGAACVAALFALSRSSTMTHEDAARELAPLAEPAAAPRIEPVDGGDHGEEAAEVGAHAASAAPPYATASRPDAPVVVRSATPAAAPRPPKPTRAPRAEPPPPAGKPTLEDLVEQGRR